MKTTTTCNNCTDSEGKPQLRCELRSTCPDDASTTEKRKEILTPYPTVED